MKMTKWTMCLGAVWFTACGVQSQEETRFQGQNNAAVEQEGSYLGVDETSDDEAVAEDLAEYGDVLELRTIIKALRNKMRTQISECAGISNDFDSFRELKEKLVAQGLSKEEIHIQLKQKISEMRDAIRKNQTVVKECREKYKDSELGIALSEIFEVCTVKKEFRKKGDKKEFRRKNHALRRGQGNQPKNQNELELQGKRHKQKRGFHGQAASAECFNTVMSARSLLD